MSYDETEKLPFAAYAEDIGEGIGENYMVSLRGEEPNDDDEDDQRQKFKTMMTLAAVTAYFDDQIDNHPDREDPADEEREQAFKEVLAYVSDEIERDYGVVIK